jgi:hypothetical protein
MCLLFMEWVGSVSQEDEGQEGYLYLQRACSIRLPATSNKERARANKQKEQSRKDMQQRKN